ncbi:MAG TPA: hypothetical protein VK886_08270 [Vicinamibacterales bacterium]|nr:hypothetical protein [Vicinamibacterales bacterium]
MVTSALVLVLALAQQPVPQPFPRPGSPQRPSAPATDPAPRQPPVAQPPAAPAPQAPVQDPAAPSQATLGMPVYPGATYLAAFDAGQGQRYYLFGTNASYVEIVAYYKTYLKERGNEIFDNDPPTHVFEIGRFREETMAYAPGITVKDYTWNGSQGYLHVKPGAAPQRFKTVIQVVPASAAPER